METFRSILMIAVIALTIYRFHKKRIYWKYIFGTRLYYFILFSIIGISILIIKFIWN